MSGKLWHFYKVLILKRNSYRTRVEVAVLSRIHEYVISRNSI